MFAHEGGYSEDYVPWCGLAVLDKMLCTGATATTVLLEDHTDPYLSEAKGVNILSHSASLLLASFGLLYIHNIEYNVHRRDQCDI